MAIALAGAAASHDAFGQFLNLKPGAGAPIVAGEATAALIEHLNAEAGRLRDELGRADAKAGGELDPKSEDAFKFRIAARHRAADLLTLASDLGDAGAPQALAALTLVARFDAIDAWGAAIEREATGPTPAGDAAMAFTLSEADLASCRDVESLDRWLARALGPRARALGPAPSATWDGLRLHAGWVPAGEISRDPATLTDLAARWSTPGRGDQPAARERRLSADAAAALRAFDAAQAQAATSWGDAGANARLEHLIRAAGRVMDGLDPIPPREAADALASRFDAACLAIGRAELGGISALEQLAAVVDLVDDTARALSMAPRGLNSSAKDMVWKYLWKAHLGSSFDDRARRDSLRRAVDAILNAARATNDNDVIREARPVLRRLKAEMEMAQRELWVAVARPTARNPMDDPGIVGSLATVKRLDSVMRGLAIVSKPLKPPPKGSARKPDPAPAKARERLLALAKDMEKPSTHDAAMNALLLLLDAGDAFAPGAAERALRDTPLDAAWTAASAGKCPELLAALDSARSAALKSWGEASAEADASITRVRSLARLVDLVYCGAIGARIAREATADRAGLISRHPGVELSGAAAAALLPDLEPAAARLVPLVMMESLRDPALNEVDKLHAASAAARLFARLETDARAMDLADIDPATELSAGMGPRPWLAGQRTDLALICWNAQELAGAQLNRDRDQAAQRTTQINEFATRVLDGLERRR